VHVYFKRFLNILLITNDNFLLMIYRRNLELIDKKFKLCNIVDTFILDHSNQQCHYPRHLDEYQSRFFHLDLRLVEEHYFVLEM